LPKWLLGVLLADEPATTTCWCWCGGGAKLDDRGVLNAGSSGMSSVFPSHSGRAVRKGSSGGRCCIVGNESRDRYDLKDGGAVLAKTRSCEGCVGLGSTSLTVGVSRARGGAKCSVRECRDDLGRLKTNPASADCCLRKKLPAVSVEGLLELDMVRSGFTTCSWPDDADSRYPSPAPTA
jgi:hypothetical protein